MSTYAHKLVALLNRAVNNDDAIEASKLAKKLYLEIQSTGVDYE